VSTCVSVLEWCCEEANNVNAAPQIRRKMPGAASNSMSVKPDCGDLLEASSFFTTVSSVMGENSRCHLLAHAKNNGGFGGDGCAVASDITAQRTS